jgi:hypothetical protein
MPRDFCGYFSLARGTDSGLDAGLVQAQAVFAMPNHYGVKARGHVGDHHRIGAT